MLFSLVDPDQFVTLMKEHICAVEPLINYDSDDGADIYKLEAAMYS